MQAKGIGNFNAVQRIEFKRDIFGIGLGEGVEFFEQEPFNILRLGNEGAASARARGKHIKENIVPLLPDAHGADAYAMLGDFGCKGEALLLVAIGVPVC